MSKNFVSSLRTVVEELAHLPMSPYDGTLRALLTEVADELERLQILEAHRKALDAAFAQRLREAGLPA